jgi:hypothetical protein
MPRNDTNPQHDPMNGLSAGKLSWEEKVGTTGRGQPRLAVPARAASPIAHPAFAVKHEIHCDVALYRQTRDRILRPPESDGRALRRRPDSTSPSSTACTCFEFALARLHEHAQQHAAPTSVIRLRWTCCPGDVPRGGQGSGPPSSRAGDVYKIARRAGTGSGPNLHTASPWTRRRPGSAARPRCGPEQPRAARGVTTADRRGPGPTGPAGRGPPRSFAATGPAVCAAGTARLAGCSRLLAELR